MPYITVSGRGYYDRPEVRDLTALLACLHNPADDLSTATVLRSPMFSLSDEALYRLRWFDSDGKACDAPIPFSVALASAADRTPALSGGGARSLAAAETLVVLRGGGPAGDVWTLLRMALDRTGYEATLSLADMEATTRTSAGGGRGRANLAKFLQLARERGGADLSTFLQSRAGPACAGSARGRGAARRAGCRLSAVDVRTRGQGARIPDRGAG